MKIYFQFKGSLIKAHILLKNYFNNNNNNTNNSIILLTTLIIIKVQRKHFNRFHKLACYIGEASVQNKCKKAK